MNQPEGASVWEAFRAAVFTPELFRAFAAVAGIIFIAGNIERAQQVPRKGAGVVCERNDHCDPHRRRDTHHCRGPIGASQRRVTTVENTQAAGWLESEGIDYEPVADVDAAVERLENGDSDAFVFDSPVLKYERSQRQGARLEVGGELFDPVPYGIALPPGSPLREQINTSMLDMLTDGSYDRILKCYGG